ncbi:MAG: magnesium transporter CorA family protein [Candidatus Magasanikbacteria bacterium]|jgi:magnesium transporter|nr:magnesium transporter CorA family protein [Candidatus Magasanikbacteria bacterium]
MGIKTLRTEKLTWVNITSLDAESLAYLREHYSFHHLDMEDIQGDSQTPKIDTYKNYLFIVLQFPQWKSSIQSIIPHGLDIFIGQDYLITIQHSKSKDMKNFFYRCMKNKSVKNDWMSQSSGYLLYKLLEALFKNTQPILNNMGKQLSLVEDKIFQEEQDIHVVKQLAMHRRNILQFRRIIDPQRHLIANMSHIRKPFLNEETSLYFDNINDYLSKLWSIVDTYKDTVDGLHVTTESLITQRTNKVIRLLTTISVALLPFTVLSSIYGMNIRALPYAQHPFGVWLMFGFLTVVVVVAILFMRKKF